MFVYINRTVERQHKSQDWFVKHTCTIVNEIEEEQMRSTGLVKLCCRGENILPDADRSVEWVIIMIREIYLLSSIYHLNFSLFKPLNMHVIAFLTQFLKAILHHSTLCYRTQGQRDGKIECAFSWGI